MPIIQSSIQATAQILDAYAGGSAVTNPAAGAILADTGALAAGRYYFSFLCDATVAARFRRERRNAGNTANLNPTKELPIPANTEIDTLYGIWVDIAEGERVRVLNVNAFTGDATALIMYGRVL
jgi:hypothetical protein